MCATQSGTENYFLKPEVFASKVVRVDWTPSTSGGDYQLSNVAVLTSFDFVLVSRWSSCWSCCWCCLQDVTLKEMMQPGQRRSWPWRSCVCAASWSAKCELCEVKELHPASQLLSKMALAVFDPLAEWMEVCSFMNSKNSRILGHWHGLHSGRTQLAANESPWCIATSQPCLSLEIKLYLNRSWNECREHPLLMMCCTQILGSGKIIMSFLWPLLITELPKRWRKLGETSIKLPPDSCCEFKIQNYDQSSQYQDTTSRHFATGPSLILPCYNTFCFVSHDVDRTIEIISWCMMMLTVVCSCCIWEAPAAA